MEKNLKDLEGILELVKELKKNNKEEFEKVKFKMIELLEIQILKKEFIENIQRCNNFKNLNTLNGMLKMVMNK